MPWEIDHAFLRPPRMTEKIYVGLPDAEAREYLIRRKMDEIEMETPFAEDFDMVEAVKITEGYNSADVAELCESMKDSAIARTLSEGGRILARISGQDLKDAAQRIPSSVHTEDIEKIRKWEETQNKA